MASADSLVILDGGGTIWYSMDVLWEHYQSAFSYFGLLRPEEFQRRFPFRELTRISSFASFNSRKNVPAALLALLSSGADAAAVLEGADGIEAAPDPERHLRDLFVQACLADATLPRLFTRMGRFLTEALYQYPDANYPPCTDAREGLMLMREAGCSIALLTNRKRASAEAILKRLNVFDLFHHIEAPPGDHEPTMKPVEGLLDRFGIGPGDLWKVAFIGDSNVDLRSAHAHRLLTIAVRCGTGDDVVWRTDPPAMTADTLVDAARALVNARNSRREIYAAFRKTLEGRAAPTLLEPLYVHQLLTRADGTVCLGPLWDHVEAETASLSQACVYVAVTNTAGHLFEQPGRTIFASGHVEAGETFDEAAVRELHEQVGMTSARPALIGSFTGEQHCGPVYNMVVDAPLAQNEAEMGPGRSRFLSLSDLEDLLGNEAAITQPERRALEVWLKFVGART